MDSRFRIPGTNVRFGLDPIIGLIPVVGDPATLLVGVAMFAEAIRLRVSAHVYRQMLWNLALDWLVGLVPGIDLVLDTAFKAHSENAALLERQTRVDQSFAERGEPSMPSTGLTDSLSNTRSSLSPKEALL